MATVTFQWFSRALANEQGGTVLGESYAIDFLSDTIKCALLTSSYTPDIDVNALFSDLTNEVAGTGYTAGGLALTTKTLSVVPANSWSVARADTTAYAAGDVVRPATPNGYLYRCVVAGTSAGTPPTFSTTVGRETADGSVVWSTVGSAAISFDCDDPIWPASTITARYAVIYKATGTPSTSPLMLLGTFSGDVASTSGQFGIILPSTGFAVKVRA